jgi:O-antigen/teichoic acid export membrane protein
MDAAKRVAKNTGILYARIAITVFISLYATRITLAALGIEDFGLFNLVAGVIAMLGFLNNSMMSATQRFMSYTQGEGNPEKVNTIFNISLLLHFGITLLVLVFLESAGYFLFNGLLNIAENRLETAKMVYQCMILTTLFSILTAPFDAILTTHENQLFFAILSIVESALKLCIAFYITDTPLDHLLTYGYLIAALSISLLIVKQLYCYLSYAECKLSRPKQQDKILFAQMLGFAGWNFLGSVASLLANYGQGMVLNIYFGATFNAAQGVANQVSGQLSVFAGSMLKALNPLLDKSAGAGNHQLMLSAALMGSKIGFFLLMLLYIPAIIEMPYIFKLWLINPPELVVVFCRLLLLRDLLGQLFVTLSSAISAVGHIKKFQIYSSLLTLLPLPITALFFYFGYTAVTLYWIYLVYTAIMSMLILFFAKVYCMLSITYFLRTVVSRCFLTLLLCTIISSIPSFYMPEDLIRLVLTISISLTSSIILIALIGFTKQERQKIGQVLISLFSTLATRLGLGKNFRSA